MANHDQLKDNCLYFDMSKQERDSAIRYLLGSIIKCRRDGNFPSNYYTFDEDVNVYLAHLLFAISLPEYHEMAEPYLSLDTSDILRWVKTTDDRTIRYFIFKVNADNILIHTAVFDDLLHKNSSKLFKRSHKHYRELAQLYYDQAALYHTKIYRKKTGVGEVLTKLSHYFDAYQALLKLVRREYFDFVTHFRDNAFSHFMNELCSYETEFQRKSKMDRFLELYGHWLETQNPGLEQEIERLASELRRLDPSFHFDLKQRKWKSGGIDDERKCA